MEYYAVIVNAMLEDEISRRFGQRPTFPFAKRDEDRAGSGFDVREVTAISVFHREKDNIEAVEIGQPGAAVLHLEIWG
jgi:hypothetical protein